MISRSGKVKGTPIVGETLKAKPGLVAPTTATASYAWLRNGVPIVGATAQTYVVGPDDVGTQLAAMLVLAQAGYTSATETVTADGSVKVATTTTVKVKGRQLKAAVKVSVAGIGVTTLPTGSVTVKVRNRKKTVPLVNGAAHTSFVGFLKGPYPVIVRYNGDDVAMLPSKTTDTVNVR
jgi:2',3'-cyclic-nucleotide 2'-phosphodiesterase (5'-nucleotidase family)